MKFAKTLEENSVPEWRKVYLDYKQGKKRIKKVAKARRLHSTSNHSFDASAALPPPALDIPDTGSPQSDPEATEQSRGYGSLGNTSRRQPSRVRDAWVQRPRSIPEDMLDGSPPESPEAKSPKPPPTVQDGHAVGRTGPSPRLRTAVSLLFRSPRGGAMEMEACDDFFPWLDGELKKINEFYKERETEAIQRLQILRNQLQTMRDMQSPTAAAKKQRMTTHIFSHDRDFSRKNDAGMELTPYRTARRKLRAAMIEYYRGLELLKSYRLLNRTGFQKIMKKYSKATSIRTAGRYMDKVTSSHFGASDVADLLMNQTEDLYAHYFERGNRKNAVERLRTKERSSEHYGAMFRSGVFLGIGVPFAILGVIEGLQRASYDPNASYELQIYGGFALVLLLLLSFGVNIQAWVVARINYVFIFEFDPKDALDYRQFLELPCLLAGILGIVIYFTFNASGFPSIYYPVLYLGLSAAVFFNPFDFGYRAARRWLIRSCGRTLLSGLLPVEFRDFFLGDQFCSLTYPFAGLPLFFCLYAHHWTDNPQCNSSHSRIQGFFQALPGILRFLQCMRRYYDTRNVFPHLVNGLKYMSTIVFYMTLSLWRIDQTDADKAGFIFTAVVYCLLSSWWDLFMDWSLLHPYSKWPFLRDELGYKKPWVYYAAMFVDPVVRSSWIFYVIFPQNAQHSASLSFFVSLAEVLRRSMWNFFRVENEHCTNVGRFRAVRDNIPLPYAVVDEERAPLTPPSAAVAKPTPSPSILRRRKTGQFAEYARARAGSTSGWRALAYATTAIQDRHAEDFERRRPSTAGSRVQDEEASSSADDEMDRDDHEDAAIQSSPKQLARMPTRNSINAAPKRHSNDRE